jgi:2-C-methyl-D-erythritol 4-phosphate cytidylyltransferase
VRDAEVVSVWVIVVAAGGGTRFGGAKQFERLGDSMVIDRSVETARSCTDGVVVVLPAAGAEWRAPDGVATVVGGATRTESVRAGLEVVPPEADVIVVHDAARPLATTALYEATIAAVREGAAAAIPGMSVSDTIKRVDGTTVVTTVDRGDLVAVQTPQAFAATALRAAHARADAEGTDDAALVEALGGTVVVVTGEPRNLKLTVADDLAIARALLELGDHR